MLGSVGKLDRYCIFAFLFRNLLNNISSSINDGFT